MPQLEGYEFAAWNQPADQTGGDYYDWQLLPDGKVVLALADVTGHGIGPALLGRSVEPTPDRASRRRTVCWPPWMNSTARWQEISVKGGS
jgi:hypothetical protein